MKKHFFVLIMAAMAAMGAMAQEDAPRMLVRQGTGLSFNGNHQRLSDWEARELLGAEEYALYERGHRQKVAAVPLFVLSAIGLADGLAWTGVTAYDFYGKGNSHTAVASTWAVAGFGLAFLAGIPAVLLNGSGNSHIDAAALGHNCRKACPELSLKMLPAGMGLTLSF